MLTLLSGKPKSFYDSKTFFPKRFLPEFAVTEMYV